MLSRKDVGPECNTARRLFWEKCASRAISLLPNEERESVYDNWHNHGKFYDYVEFAAALSDSMLTEWDKRWIVEATNDKEITK